MVQNYFLRLHLFLLKPCNEIASFVGPDIPPESPKKMTVNWIRILHPSFLLHQVSRIRQNDHKV